MVGSLHAHARLFRRRRTDDLAIANLDATGVGSCGGAIRLYRAAIMGAVWQDRPADDWIARRDQYSILRTNGAPDSLVAIQRLPDDFIYALVHYSRRIRYRRGVCLASQDGAAQFVAWCRGCGDRRWRIDICLLRSGL